MHVLSKSRAFGYAAAIALCLLTLASVSVQAASSNISVKVCAPPVSPTITSPANGTKTKQSSIMLSGTATANSTVYVMRNSAQIGFVTAGGDGAYSLSVSLVSGNNVLQTRVTSECGESADSNLVTVQRHGQPDASSPAPTATTGSDSGLTPLFLPGAETGPVVTTETSEPDAASGLEPLESCNAPVAILEPRSGTRTRHDTIVAEGSAAPGCTIRLMLDGLQIAEVLSDDQGEFAVSIALEPGENHLVAAVGGEADEQRSPVVVIYYESYLALFLGILTNPIVLGGLGIGTAAAAYFWLAHWHRLHPGRLLLRLR